MSRKVGNVNAGTCGFERCAGIQLAVHSMMAAVSLPGAASTLSARQSDRIQQAVRREQKSGLLLGLRLRLVVLALVAVYLLSFGLDPSQIIDLSALAALCISGWAQYRIAGTRLDQPAVLALFPVADALLVLLAIFSGIEQQGFPRVIMDEVRPVTWLFLLLTMQALAYRPWLAAWSGLVTGVLWIVAFLWMLAYPGAHGSLRVEVPPGADPVPLFLAAFYDPLFINADAWVREALLALVCGCILAVAVRRSQGMMSRALLAERSRANLARYFSPSMVDQLAAHDQPFDTAREQEIGVLFADLVGFTRYAETSSPQHLIQMLREFHGRVAQVVFEHGGTLDKFIGDCVMATFGTPTRGSNDATRTIACCCAIASAVEDWNEARRSGAQIPVKIGIGAHYGRVVTGDIGDERRLEFAVLGDTVNVASRLEALTRKLSCTILISDDLVQAAKLEAHAVDDLLARFGPVEPQELRNRAERVSLWSSPSPVA
jgi:adenylate cyclase